MKIELDPELENSRLARFLRYVLYALGIPCAIYSFFIISMRPWQPDPGRGFVVPIPNHGGFIYLTKFEYFLVWFGPITCGAWLVLSVAVLNFFQQRRNRDRFRSDKA